MTERTPLADRPCRPSSIERGVASADTLASLADRVRRLCPSHRDPEAFHMDKWEIEKELRKLAHQQEGTLR
jgi:hypothetical protein